MRAQIRLLLTSCCLVLMVLAASGAVVRQFVSGGGGEPSRASDDRHLVERHSPVEKRDEFVERLTGRRRTMPGNGNSQLFVDPQRVQRERAEFVTRLRDAGPHRRALFEGYIDMIGANGILDGIEQLWPGCHEQAHDLGRLVHRRVHDIATSLRVCADRCNSGCMHGVLMAAFGETPEADQRQPPEPSNLKSMMHDVCYRHPEMIASYSRGDCAHGVGHALMFLMGYDVGRAIGACNQFREPAMRYYCATGAYMEYVVERDPEDAKYRSLFYPCDTFEYPAACGRYKVGYVAGRHYGAARTPAALVNECEKLSGKFRRACFHGVGNAHMSVIAGGKISLSEVCLRAGNKDEQFVCIEGAIERMAKYHEPRARQVCDELLGSDRGTCFGAVKNGMYSMTKDLSLYLQ